MIIAANKDSFFAGLLTGAKRFINATISITTMNDYIPQLSRFDAWQGRNEQRNF